VKKIKYDIELMMVVILAIVIILALSVGVNRVQEQQRQDQETIRTLLVKIDELEHEILLSQDEPIYESSLSELLDIALVHK
jgi:hypothetical protein